MMSNEHEKLERASFDVFYENTTLQRHARRLYEEASKPERDQDLVTSLLESTLVHARSLLHFLNWDRGIYRKDRDVVVEDFFKPDPAPTVPAPSTVQAIPSDDINKQIGHISYGRKRPGRDWSELFPAAVDIHQEVVRVMGLVDPAKLCNEWARFLAARPQGGKPPGKVSVATTIHPSILANLGLRGGSSSY